MQYCNDEGVKLETEIGKHMDINLLRGLSYVFSILSYLQDESVCKRCKTFVEVLETMQDKFIEFEKATNKNKAIKHEKRELLVSIYSFLANLNVPNNPVKQKNAGECCLPQGLCFAKSALTFYEMIEKTMHKEVS